MKAKGSEGSIFLSVPKACELTSLGRDTVRRLAKESGAWLRIGTRTLIDRDTFFKYIRETYSANN